MQLSKKDESIQRLNEELVKTRNDVNIIHTSMTNLQKALELQEKAAEKVGFLTGFLFVFFFILKKAF